MQTGHCLFSAAFIEESEEACSSRNSVDRTLQGMARILDETNSLEMRKKIRGCNHKDFFTHLVLGTKDKLGKGQILGHFFHS